MKSACSQQTTDEVYKIDGTHENQLFQIVGELRQRRESDDYNNIIIQQLKEENFELKLQKKNTEQTCCQIKEESEKHISEQKKVYEEKISKIQQEKAKIQVRVDCLQKEMEDIKNEARDIHVENLTLEKTISELKGHIHIQSNLQDNVQNQLNQVNSFTEKLRKTCKELGTTQESLREDVNHAISLCDKVENTNNQYSQKLEDLLQEYQVTKNHVTLLRTNLQETSVLPAQDSAIKLEELKLQIKHKHDELVALQTILEKSRKQNTSNLESLEASHKLIDKYIDLLKEAVNEKEEITRKLNSVTKENNDLEGKLKKTQAKLDQYIREWRLKELMKSDTYSKGIQTDIHYYDSFQCHYTKIPTDETDEPNQSVQDENEQHKLIPATEISEEKDYGSNQPFRPSKQDGNSAEIISDRGIKELESTSSLNCAAVEAIENETGSLSLSTTVTLKTTCAEIQSSSGENSDLQRKVSSPESIKNNKTEEIDIETKVKHENTTSIYTMESLATCQISSLQKNVNGDFELGNNIYIREKDTNTEERSNNDSNKDIISIKECGHNAQESWSSEDSQNLDGECTKEMEMKLCSNTEPNQSDRKKTISSEQTTFISNGIEKEGNNDGCFTEDREKDYIKEVPPVNENHNRQLQNDFSYIKDGNDATILIGKSPVSPPNPSNTPICKRDETTKENNNNTSRNFKISESFLNPPKNTYDNMLLVSLQKHSDIPQTNIQTKNIHEPANQQTYSQLKLQEEYLSRNNENLDNASNHTLSKSYVNFNSMELPVLVQPLFNYCNKTIAPDLISHLEPLSKSSNDIIPLEQKHKDIFTSPLQNIKYGVNYDSVISQSYENICGSGLPIQSTDGTKDKLRIFTLPTSDKTNFSETVQSIRSSIGTLKESVSRSPTKDGTKSVTLLGSTSLSSILSKRMISYDIGKRSRNILPDIKFVPPFKKSNYPNGNDFLTE